MSVQKSPRKYTIAELFITPRVIYEEEHIAFRAKFQEFINSMKLKQQLHKWEENGQVDKDIFHKAHEEGFYLPHIGKEYGGHALLDFRYNAIISEELEYNDLGSVFFPLGNDIVLPYFTHIKTAPKDKLISPSHLSADEQKAKWLPYIVQNKSIISVCMSEPNAGSDLQNIKTSAKWDDAKNKFILSGSKLWISSGALADLHIIVAVTGDVSKFPVHKCLSLFVVKADSPGFRVTKVLHKVGRHAQDTVSLHLNKVEVSPDCLLGEYNKGFAVLMANLPQERLGIAVSACAGAFSVIKHTLNYISFRRLFQRTISDFQYVQLNMAEFITQANTLQLAIDSAILLHTKGQCNSYLSSMLKQQATELYSNISSKCVQFLGGIGYIKANPVANHFVDSKVTTIYGGSNQIMLEIIARRFGLERAPAPGSEALAIAETAKENEKPTAKL